MGAAVRLAILALGVVLAGPAAAGARDPEAATVSFPPESVVSHFALATNRVLGQLARWVPDEGWRDHRTALIDLDAETATGVPSFPVLGSWQRVSATRAVIGPGSGQDFTWGTADDGFSVYDGIGGANRSTFVPVGFFGDGDPDGWRQPDLTRLDHDTIVVSSTGPDRLQGGGDDNVVLVDDLGGTHRTVRLAGAGLPHPTLFINPALALSPTSFLIESTPVDAPPSSSAAPHDVHVFTDVTTEPRHHVVRVPDLALRSGGNATRLSATRALFHSYEDGWSILVLDDIGRTNRLTVVPAPSILRGTPHPPVALRPDLAVLIDNVGPAEGTLVVATDLDGSPTLTRVPVGGIVMGSLARLGPDSVAFDGPGPDRQYMTDDDEIRVLSDVGRGNVLSRIPVGTLGEDNYWGTYHSHGTELVPLSPTSLYFAASGADREFDSPANDDELVLVTGIGEKPRVERVLAGSLFHYLFPPTPIGNGRILSRHGIPLIVSGLPDGITLEAKSVRLHFDPERPERGARIHARARFALPEPGLFASEDLTVRVGEAVQTVPAAAFERNRRGWRYRDPQGERGFLRSVRYDAARGRLSVRGQGIGTGVEGTLASNVVLSLDSFAFSISQVLDGEHRPRGIVVRRRSR